MVIIPIGEDENVTNALDKITEDLKDSLVTFKIDNTNKTPGFKFAEAEVKGYPIRLEIGKRDLANGYVTLVRRDTLEKIQVSVDDAAIKINELLINIQNDMYEKAKERRDSMLYEAKNYEEMTELSKKPGFIYTNWCGNVDCENKIKDDLGLKSRCIPFDNNEPDGNKKCVCCGNDATTKIYWAKQY